MAVYTDIDDRDPRIKYIGSWVNQYGTSGNYSYTLTGTLSVGDTATLNFTGWGIEVYGSIYTNNLTTNGIPTVDPVSNYTIDSGIPYQYTGRRQAYEQPAQIFFGVLNLTASPHSLVITNIANDGWLTLDSFTVFGDTNQSTSMLLSTTSTSLSSTVGAAMVTVTAQVSGKHTNPVVGAPIGGAIAGFAVVCLIFYFLLSRRRRHQRALQLPTTQSTSHSYSEILPAQQRQHHSNINPFVIGEPSQNTLPPSYPEIPPTQQRQHPSNITPFVVGEQSHQPSTRPSQPNTKQERNANENGSDPAPEGVVAPSYTKNPVSAGERLPLFYPDSSPGAQQQRPSNITPFIVGEASLQVLEGPSEPNADSRAKQGNNSVENRGSPAPEAVVVPSNTIAAVPAGEIRVSAGERRVSAGEGGVSNGERQQVVDLPPAYTALPDVI